MSSRSVDPSRATSNKGVAAGGRHPTPDAAEEPERSAEPGRSGGAGADEDPVAAARTIVLRQLAVQPRTKAELARTLRRKGVDDEIAEHVLGRLSEVGLIDDAAFAQAWVESRHAGRGLARKALAHELQRRGVDRKDIEAAVEQLPPETELATARKLVARKLASTRRLEPQARLRRLVGMLARKGYSSGIALRAVRETLAEEDAEVPEGLAEALEAEPPDDQP